MRIVQFSDVHIREDFSWREAPKFGWRRTVALGELKFGGRARDFGDAGGTLANLAEAIEREAPGLILFSGDFTALSTHREFADARALLKNLLREPRRFCAVPGNHDRYTPASVNERRFEQYFGDCQTSDLPEFALSTGYPFVRLFGDTLAVIGLDTSLLAPFPGISFGRLDFGSLDRLRRILALDEIQRRRVMVLMHHAPFGPKGRPDTPTHGLQRSRPLMEVLMRHPRLTIHCGHIHRRYQLPAAASHPPIFNPGSGTLHGSPGFFAFELSDTSGEIESVREVRIEAAG